MTAMDKRRTGDWTIGDAADLLGVSGKTVRRWIKSGKVEAHQVKGQFGLEWHITAVQGTGAVEQTADLSTTIFTDLLREKDRRIEQLTFQLGQVTERVSQLETKLLKSGGQRGHWWQRLFSRK